MALRKACHWQLSGARFLCTHVNLLSLSKLWKKKDMVPLYKVQTPSNPQKSTRLLIRRSLSGP